MGGRRAVGALVALAIIGALLVTPSGAPMCGNYVRTASDSGYQCKLNRSSGATDFVLSRDTTLTLPLAWAVIVGLAVLGGVLVARSRRP